LGDIIANTNIVPLVTAQNKLGLPTRRWKEIWVASGSIYMQDETLGIDLRMTARDGNFVVDGAAGLKVGEFTLRDNKILLSNPNRDIIIGQEIASGSVIFNRPLQVNTFVGSGSFLVDKSGRTQLIVPNIPAGDVGALSIIGNTSGSYQPVTNAGGLLHLTSNDGVSSRITSDAFGTTAFAAYVGRKARGTVANPLPVQSNDTLTRISAIGWTGPEYGFTMSSSLSTAPTSIDVIALENFTTSSFGTAYRLFNTPIGNTTRVLSAQIDTSGLIVPNIPTNNTATQVLVWDSVSGRIGKQSGANNLDGGAAASVYLSVSEELNGGGA
jgi:hypothetical protein